MKFVHFTIRNRGRSPRLDYPEVLDIAEFEGARTGKPIYNGGIQRDGGPTEEMVVGMRDATADKYARHPRVKILTRQEAEAWFDANYRQDPASERVDDPDRLLAIIAKKSAGLELSPGDLRALDPADPEPGVRAVPRKALGDFYPEG